MLKKFLIPILTICLLANIPGCKILEKENETRTPNNLSQEHQEKLEEDMRKTTFYYVNENGLLVPFTRTIPWEEGIAKAAIENLVDTPQLRLKLKDKGLKPSLPAETEVLGMTIYDGTAKVDLSADFLTCKEKSTEKNALDALVYTLTEFPTIERVQLYIEGKPYNCPKGNNERILYREKINLEPSDSKTKTQPITLYFKSVNNYGDQSYFIPVTRLVENVDDVLKCTLDELIAGPMDDMGLLPVLPKDTKVLNVKQDGSEVTVDFSKEVKGYGGGIDTEQTLVNSVVLTISQFDKIESVNVLVEGKTDVLPEGTVLDKPILKPIYINQENI